MKRYFRKILLIITALLFALPLLLLAACKPLEPRDEADVIPDTLGTSEGLWLYKGNWRSRTDGTEEEKLLTSVTVDGEEYGEEDFSIIDYQYVRGTFEIFYIIRIDTDIRLCHYNYFTKVSSDLYDLPDVDDYRAFSIQVSSSLVYIKGEKTDFGVIFSRTAQLLYEDFVGTLDGNIVYRFEGKDFVYFMNGEKHVVPLGFRYSNDQCERYGNYVYLFASTVYAVNLETEEPTLLEVFNTTADRYHYNNDSYFLNGSLFVISGNYSSDHTNDERLYQFIRIKGASAEVAYDFGNVSYGVTMYIDGNTIYLVKGAGRGREKKYFAYDSKTGKIESVSAKTVKQGKSTADMKRSLSAVKKDITVGEYTFYVTSIGYDKVIDGFMGGSYYDKTCYYLMRRHYGTEEVMQYSLNTNNGYFYDDICEL